MLNRIFTITLFLAFFASMTSLSAQDSSPNREVGLQFNGLNFDGFNGFSLFYKKQKSENVYRRIRFFYGNLNVEAINDISAVSFSSGIAIGREKRKALDAKLAFYQGPEFSAALGVTTQNWDNTSINVSGRFGWILGLQHSFNERWAINLETIPGVGIGVNSITDSDPRFTFNAGISNSVSLGLVRKF